MQRAVVGLYGSTHDALGICVFVGDAAESVRQPERARPQSHAEPIGKPFGQEEDAGLAVVPNIGAKVEKLVRSDRLEKPLAEVATEARPHSPEREGDDADKGASFPQIERERNLPLQERWISLVMDEDRSLPRGQEKRFARVGQQAALACFAQIAGEDRRRHHTEKLFGNSYHAERFVAELRQF